MTALCCFLLGRLLFLLRDCIGELVSAMVDSPEGTDKDKKIKLSHGLNFLLQKGAAAQLLNSKFGSQSSKYLWLYSILLALGK